MIEGINQLGVFYWLVYRYHKARKSYDQESTYFQFVALCHLDSIMVNVLCSQLCKESEQISS